MQGTYIIHTFAAQLKKIASINCPKTSEEMNIENVKSQMRKGMLEYCVLLLISKEAAYSSDIIGKLKAANLIVVEGTLYPLLTRLKNDGLLTYEWKESMQGPPRKYYSLTADGQEVLQALNSVWNELSDTVLHLKEHTQPNVNNL